MEILGSGSFINLEDQEKIERLIFTAREIAETAFETEGFVSDAENNKRLVSEIWDGAGYRCRDLEKVSVRNIFITNFLDRLEEIKPEKDPINSEAWAENATDREVIERGEFITGESNEKSTEEIEASADSQEKEEEIIQAEQIESRDELEGEVSSNSDRGNDSSLENPKELSNPSTDEKPKPDHHPENIPKQIVEPLCLPEKEPYRWDKSTVTATIQILPVDENKVRKAVLSVRTHDFVPNISIVEIGGEDPARDLCPELEKAFEKYQSDLPVKVMDKLRKEKESPQKRSYQQKADKPKKSISLNSDDSKAKTDQTEETEIMPPTLATQRSSHQQGSLFNS